MNKLTAPEVSGEMVLDIFRCNGIPAGGMMLFPAISAQFMQVDWRGHFAPVIPNADRPSDHHWSYVHTRLPEWQGPDLSAGIRYLVERGYLEQGTENRIAYFLTDAGFAAPRNQEATDGQAQHNHGPAGRGGGQSLPGAENRPRA